MTEQSLVRRGRPAKYGLAMSSAERNALRRGKMVAVVEAAEVWARCFMSPEGGGLAEAQARLDAAVGAWLAYRGKGPIG